MPTNLERAVFPAADYDLAATLTSGQAFRWRECGGAWEGVVGYRWVRLRAQAGQIIAQTSADPGNWDWMRHYLQLGINLNAVLAAFPTDPAMQASVAACRGLRLLRQDQWECLASFICSSTKQIVQIRQIIALLCERFGEPCATPPGAPPAWSFPTVERIAAASEAELRACKLGFRAPYLLGTARKLAAGEVNLARVANYPLAEAREELCRLPGVGHKIADCALLFGFGFEQAFPVDVWVMRALRQLYFPKRKPKPRRLRHFVTTHFGPRAGYAQQYLFHYMRTKRPAPARIRKT